MEDGELLGGRYRLARQQAGGILSSVWVGHDELLDRDVAIKQVHTRDHGPEFVARLRLEAAIGARLQHPNITVVYDIGFHKERVFIVMELLRGVELKAILRENPGGLPVPRVISFGIQLADALAAAHNIGVVHRDIKPGNLFIQARDRLKVCDFGIASLSTAPSLEEEGRLIGTPLYMAPEQLEGRPARASMDLYAMGCTLYEMLTGRPPFDGPNVVAIVHQHLHNAPTIPTGSFPLPEPLVELTMGLLEKDPARRPESAAAVAQALGDIRDRASAVRIPTHQDVAGTASSQTGHPAGEAADEGLIFRAYVPADRLYAAELDKFLSLFRGWLSGVRGYGIRQDGYETRAGKVYEFYVTNDSGDIDLDQERADFSEFLALCVADPPAAAGRLEQEGMGRSEASSFASRYGREIRRLNLDLKQERERRVLDIWHGIESDIIESGAYSEPVTRQLRGMLEALVPGLSAQTYRNILEAGGWPGQTVIEINVNQQFISAVEGAIIQNVGGTASLGPRAQELLALIAAHGGAATDSLRTAVHEMEDEDAPSTRRSTAATKLKKFLRGVGITAKGTDIESLDRYLEARLGNSPVTVYDLRGAMGIQIGNDTRQGNRFRPQDPRVG
jgi:hypothetical protein